MTAPHDQNALDRDERDAYAVALLSRTCGTLRAWMLFSGRDGIRCMINDNCGFLIGNCEGQTIEAAVFGAMRQARMMK
jgi:hypothetical protein